MDVVSPSSNDGIRGNTGVSIFFKIGEECFTHGIFQRLSSLGEATNDWRTDESVFILGRISRGFTCLISGPKPQICDLANLTHKALFVEIGYVDVAEGHGHPQYTRIQGRS